MLCLSTMKSTPPAAKCSEYSKNNAFSTRSTSALSTEHYYIESDLYDLEPLPFEHHDWSFVSLELDSLELEHFEDDTIILKRSREITNPQDVPNMVSATFPCNKKSKNSDQHLYPSAFESTSIVSSSHASIPASQALDTSFYTSLPFFEDMVTLPHQTSLNPLPTTSPYSQPLPNGMNDTSAQIRAQPVQDVGFDNATRQSLTLSRHYNQHIRPEQQSLPNVLLQQQIPLHSTYHAPSPTFLSNPNISYNDIKAARRKKRTRHTASATSTTARKS